MRRRRESSAGRPCTARETTGLASEWVEERPELRGIEQKLATGGESKVAGPGLGNNRDGCCNGEREKKIGSAAPKLNPPPPARATDQGRLLLPAARPTTGIFVAASPGSTRSSRRRMKRRAGSNCSWAVSGRGGKEEKKSHQSP